MKVSGNILKLRSKLSKTGEVSYKIPIDGKDYDCMEWIGKKVSLNFSGRINCIDSGELISKSYNNGYSFKSFQKLAECDVCMVRPSLCHFAAGTCRDESFAQKQCFIPHVVYLSYTSDFKVGITRETQVPTRFIDQGALLAKPLFIVKDRLHSGLMEDFLAKYFADKTSWKKMLTSLNEYPKNIIQEFKSFHLRILNLAHLKNLELEGCPYSEKDIISLKFPLLEKEAAQSKFSSYNLDKKGDFEDKLLGIKGQYFIFENGVINMRKYQGYHLQFEIK